MLAGRLVRTLLVATSLVACAEEGEGGDSGANGPDPIVKEVLERCSDFAARLCASAVDCCEGTSGAFSPERCAERYSATVCGPGSQLVGAGLATYDSEAEEPCLHAWSRAHETCVPDWEENLAIRQDVWAACKTFRGTTEVGGGCSTPAACTQPDGPAVATCSEHPTTGAPACLVLEVLGEGAECPFPRGDVSVCDTGLYCTTTRLDGTGTCERVVPEGEACDPSVALNSECGLGSYCGLDDGVCHRATNFGGPECARGAECVSFTCRMSSSGGTCDEARSAAYGLCALGAG